LSSCSSWRCICRSPKKGGLPDCSNTSNQSPSSTESASKDTFLNCPLPIVVFSPQSQGILWSNSRFIAAARAKERFFEARLGDVVPGFDGKWLLDGKNECPELVTLGGRRYKVFGSLIRTSSDPGSLMATTYWVDVTDYADKYDEYLGSRLVASIIVLDTTTSSSRI
jgi:c-di-AMP phosphodiesterase-like protein